jgi:phosphonate transport system permease protein
VRWSVAALLLLGAYSWIAGGFRFDLLTSRRLGNLGRFLGELRPFPLRGREFDLAVALEWAGELLHDRGLEAAVGTLAIAVAAIVLAGLAAAPLSLAAARNLASPEPFLAGMRPPTRRARAISAAIVYATRLVLIFLRSIPEYVWAFLLVALVGPSPWPAVLALAIHNTGILGKLTGEVIEGLKGGSLAALRGLGATRLQIATTALFPAVVSRFLLFLFYRWETCVREATVLGMLGIVSLGFWIQDARARNQYDTMLLMVSIGALLVLLGDLVSALARGVVKRSA